VNSEPGRFSVEMPAEPVSHMPCRPRKGHSCRRPKSSSTVTKGAN
jgi:hypothetical protein